MMRWERKRDGVIIATRKRPPTERTSSSVLASRPNGKRFWITWEGLFRKYEPLPAEPTGEEKP
jgi:hypothetical protein